jgi:hypothetical protein
MFQSCSLVRSAFRYVCIRNFEGIHCLAFLQFFNLIMVEFFSKSFVYFNISHPDVYLD